MFNADAQTCDLLRRLMHAANEAGAGSLMAEAVNEITHLRKLNNDAVTGIGLLVEKLNDAGVESDFIIHRVERTREHIARDWMTAGVVDLFDSEIGPDLFDYVEQQGAASCM